MYFNLLVRPPATALSVFFKLINTMTKVSHADFPSRAPIGRATTLSLTAIEFSVYLAS
jgi:hypothetical protein